MILIVVAIIHLPITMLNKIEKLRMFSFLGIRHHYLHLSLYSILLHRNFEGSEYAKYGVDA